MGGKGTTPPSQKFQDIGANRNLIGFLYWRGRNWGLSTITTFKHNSRYLIKPVDKSSCRDTRLWKLWLASEWNLLKLSIHHTASLKLPLPVCTVASQMLFQHGCCLQILDLPECEHCTKHIQRENSLKMFRKYLGKQFHNQSTDNVTF